jgi:tetratricopeptide (TPR) repeat protein
LGRAWLQNEVWQSAIRHFAKSAKLRENGQAYDWFRLAMAYHHLGKREEAQREYDRAVDQLKALETPGVTASQGKTAVEGGRVR